MLKQIKNRIWYIISWGFQWYICRMIWRSLSQVTAILKNWSASFSAQGCRNSSWDGPGDVLQMGTYFKRRPITNVDLLRIVLQNGSHNGSKMVSKMFSKMVSKMVHKKVYKVVYKIFHKIVYKWFTKWFTKLFTRWFKKWLAK